MILQRVLDVLAERDVATPVTIAAAIGSTPDAVRSMLATLQRRRLVQRYAPPSGCGSGCNQCSHGEGEWFRLVGTGDADQDVEGGCPSQR